MPYICSVIIVEHLTSRKLKKRFFRNLLRQYIFFSKFDEQLIIDFKSCDLFLQLSDLLRRKNARFFGQVSLRPRWKSNSWTLINLYSIN